MDLKGGTSVVVAGLRKSKEGLIPKSSPARFEVGSLLRYDKIDVVGNRKGSKTALEGLMKDRRVKCSSNPRSSLRDEHLGVVKDDSRSKGR